MPFHKVRIREVLESVRVVVAMVGFPFYWIGVLWSR